MTRKKLILFIFAFFVTFYPGCGEQNSSEGEFYAISITLAPQTQIDEASSIDKIYVIVEGYDIDTIVKEFLLTEQTKEFNGTIQVPVGYDRKLTVEAWSNNQKIYEGSKTITGKELIDIPKDKGDSIVIMLDPVEEKIVKLVPSLIEDVKTGDIFSVNVAVKNFPNLFGVTFRLQFDENFVKPVEIDALGSDKLFGNNVLYIDDIEQTNREPGTLNIGITCTTESPEDDEGIIASVKFEAIGATDETTISMDYDNIVWTESGEFPPPEKPKENELNALKVYSDHGETKVVISEGE